MSSCKKGLEKYKMIGACLLLISAILAAVAMFKHVQLSELVNKPNVGDCYEKNGKHIRVEKIEDNFWVYFTPRIDGHFLDLISDFKNIYTKTDCSILDELDRRGSVKDSIHKLAERLNKLEEKAILPIEETNE